MQDNPTAEFSFTWQALKLLGKSLYSNPWAAISELVANGFDAGAETVHVLLDLSAGKERATLEVLDDGSGMDEEGILNYVQVGRNKRIESDTKVVAHPMGRKGIGRLAALYLSDEFLLSTKYVLGASSWHLKIDDTIEENDKPRLVREEKFDGFLLSDMWNAVSTGTLLSIRNIDLRGSGGAALKALGSKLANQFLLSSMDARQIKLCIRTKRDQKIKFDSVEKQVAFKNYMLAYSHFEREADRPNQLSEIGGSTVELKVDSSKHSVPVKTGSLSDIASSSPGKTLSGTIAVLDNSGEEVERTYELTGWLAVHATIDTSLAQANDANFVKNQFYNPSQIRLYVRNKLAAENVLQMLGITQAYANYIEGEVSFNILDEDDLPDIATTNRQGFDENDPRIERLQSILKPLVRSLIRERESIMTELKEAQKEKASQTQARAKRAFLDEVREELDGASIDPGISESLLIPIANKLAGSLVHAKSSHRIFFSHASGDKDLLDVIYHALKEHGARDDEIFYTSRDKNIGDPDSYEQLKDVMRECITDAKTRILYVTSPAFRGSMFCLFEGGAGWATRGIGDFDLLTTRYEAAPVFLHNSQTLQNLIDTEGQLSLNQNVYVALVAALNNLVEHLNRGREIEGDELSLEPFDVTPIPPPHKRSKPLIEYMDPGIVSLWNQYVRVCDETQRYPPDGVEKH